jgi:uncharacterized protein (DUF433 family)
MARYYAARVGLGDIFAVARNGRHKREHDARIYCGVRERGTRDTKATRKEHLVSIQVHRHIAIDPNILVGKPIIKGTRIPVELIVRLVGQGVAEKEILKEYPRLNSDDIRAALLYAAMVVAREDIFPFDIPA